MVIYVYLDKDNRVEGWGSTPEKGTIAVTLEEEDVFLSSNPFHYEYKNEELVKWKTDAELAADILAEAEQQEREDRAPAMEERIAMLEEAILFLSLE